MSSETPPPEGEPNASGNATPEASERPKRRRRRSTDDWADRHFWELQPIRDVLLLLAIFGLLYVGYQTSIVTVPLLLAMLLAYLFEPVVKLITRSAHFSRQGAAALIIAASAFIVVVPLSALVFFGVTQGVGLVNSIRSDVLWLTSAVDRGEFDPDSAPGDTWEQLAEALIDVKLIAEEEATLRDKAADPSIETEVEPDAAPPDPGSDDPFAPFIDGSAADLASGAAIERPGDDSPIEEVAEAVLGQDDGDVSEPDADEDADIESVAGDDAVLFDSDGDPISADDRAQAALIWSLYQDVEAWVTLNRERIGQRVVGTGFNVVNWFIGGATSVGVIAFQAFLTAFFFFFVCTGWGRVLDFWESLIPERRKGRTIHLVKQMDKVIAGFVRGRLTIMLIQCVVFSIGYYLIGVPAALLVGFAVGVLSVVPYLALVGIPLSVGLMLLAGPEVGFRGEWWWQIGAPVAFYFIGQALDDYIWTPIIQGKSTDLDTPTVLFASIAGGALAGVYGLLIAIPVAACIKILVREVLWPRFREWAAGDREDPLPINRRRERS